MHRVAITAALLVVLLAAPAFAGEFEDRFHKAYAQEVVEGDTKGAAAVYLALMGEEKAPAAIRAEAKFRFAVCAVLLGRADEARIHLAELVTDKDTPKDLKVRAEEYRDAVSGIGLGTELEKRLQDLVFDLGRESPGGNVGAYRDFEIIGKRSVPFLRKLLHHTDKNLRMHAFRLLCRMDERGMAAEWKPEFHLYFIPFTQDLTAYLKRRPEELAIFEKRILEFGDKAIGMLVSMRPKPGFSLEFVVTLAGGEKHRKLAFDILYNAGTKEARYAKVREWILSDDADLSTRASFWLVPMSVAEYATDDLFPIVVRRMMEQGLTLNRHTMDQRKNGLASWCTRLPDSLLMTTLEELVVAGEKWEESVHTNPLTSGLADHPANALDRRILDEGMQVDLPRYLSLLKRWGEVEKTRNVAVRKMGGSVGRHPRFELIAHFRTILLRLPEKDATGFALWIVTEEAKGRIGRTGWGDLLSVDNAMSARILGAAIAAATPEDRRQLLRKLPCTQGRTVEMELERAQAKVVLDLAPLLEVRALQTLVRPYAQLSASLPVVEARRNVSELITRGLDMDEARRNEIIKTTYGGYDLRVGFVEDRVLPVLPPLWHRLTEAERQGYLYGALRTIQEIVRGNRVDESKALKRCVEFVRARYAELGANMFRSLIIYPDLFPPEEWMPVAPANANFVQHRMPQEQKDRISRALGKDLSKLNDSTLSFIHGASLEIRREIYTRGLASEDRRVRQLFVRRVSPSTGYPVTVETLEETLAAVLAEKDADLDELSILARILLKVRPSKKLFPAASRLISSEDRDQVLTGIRIAGSLGREDLVSDLTKLLDSMDSAIRTAAKKAIDSIYDLARLKREAPLKEKGLLPK